MRWFSGEEDDTEPVRREDGEETNMCTRIQYIGKREEI